MSEDVWYDVDEDDDGEAITITERVGDEIVGDSLTILAEDAPYLAQALLTTWAEAQDEGVELGDDGWPPEGD